MALPDLIEIIPLDKPVRAEITVPGSKSITNRALILAALADGETTLQGALWSEDTQVMVEALRKLGFEVNVEPDPEEFCNRTIKVKGLGGKIPSAGTSEKPLEIFVGNAGTAARFLSALVCLGYGVYRLHGVPRMDERPQAALFSALRELGYRVEPENSNDRLPARIFGAESPSAEQRTDLLTSKHQRFLTSPLLGGARSATVTIEKSSQFASALLLCAKRGNWKIQVIGENAEESPYVVMTGKLIEAFPNQGGTFKVEPDASSGSYFLAAQTLTSSKFMEYSPHFGVEVETQVCSSVAVSDWPDSGWQIDERFGDFLVFGPELHKFIELEKQGKLTDRQSIETIWKSRGDWKVSRRDDLGDSIMTAIVWSAQEHAGFPSQGDASRFTDLGRLRLQECERVVALRTELTKCGAKVIESDDTLEVFPSKLHGAEIETYNDHRMAMCFAILGLKVPGIKIKNPSCVKKTFPNFFQKLAAAPPHGLGAEIRDATTGRRLAVEELFAD